MLGKPVTELVTRPSSPFLWSLWSRRRDGTLFIGTWQRGKSILRRSAKEEKKSGEREKEKG